MSIASNFPAIKPTLLLDFANTEELDPRITFTRASTATYYGTQTAMAEQNLVIRSQEFDNVIWAKVRVTVTGDSTTAPDGTTTADTITNTTAAGAHEVDIPVGSVIVSGLTYTISFFAKKNTNDFFQIATFNASNTLGTGRANFNLATGVTGSVDGGTSTITDAGNGWYRCTYTVTASASGSVNIYAVIVTSSTAARFESYTGLGTESIFLWGAQLEQRSAVSAYTPTTTQTITNYIPVLETAASGVARFDHNPTTFESLGLLIEESRTNLLTYSEQFDDAAWTKTRTTITANTIVSPDGTVDGDKLVEDTQTGSHTFRNATSVTIVAGTTLTASAYFKAGEGFYCTIAIGDGGGTNLSRTAFNLSDGTVFSSNTASNNVSAPIPSITPVGNGWYRCVVTATVSNVTTAQAWYAKNASNGNFTYTGDGYSGIYIWGAQLEAGAFATSYIPTVASQVTRAADAASMTGTNFSSWYNQAQGTLYAEGKVSGGSTTTLLASVSDGTNSNRLVITTGLSNTVWNPFIITNGVSQGNFITAGTPQNNSRLAIALNTNDSSAALDGLAYATDTFVTLPVVDRMFIGAGATGTPVFAYVKKLAYYPLRATNAQLQGLTS